MVNILCNNVTGCQVKLEEINNNIYHPLIFEKGFMCLKRRFEMFKQKCQDCEISGICRGGCILTGIDAYNKMNETACTFQKETWKYYINYLSYLNSDSSH